ncbi:hypothetical protein [Noviherbaspirillum sp. Root189]|uniref:hypothetical protein n=1 Tax=Noviherbaspirillum sp. Root189 TaxID=1736487 RepID=UPI000709F631|nr:hypothetical protein [Noviherbaspirillum sp. Root189]KRB73541.1 hypothetical protein ASE07_06745 [Noviherbaspirillum sp. Root189]
MKGVAKALFALVSWATGALFLTRLWLSNPDTGLSLPAPWWQWLDGVYGSSNAEEVADLEFLIGFTIALVVLAVAGTLALCALRFVRSQQPQ